MLRPTDYDRLLDERSSDRPPPTTDALPATDRPGVGLRLRRRIGLTLISFGALLAAEARPMRPAAQRRRAY